MALCAPPASARERSSMMPTAGRMRPPTEASMSVGEKPHLVTCSACVCVLCVSGYSTGTPCLASREHGIGPIRCASGWRRRSRPSEDSEPAAVRRSGSGPSTASLSRGCPVVRHVRSCPVDVRYVSGSVSGSMSDHVRKHVRKGVRKCPMLSDDVRPILDSSTCVTVRLCPVGVNLNFFFKLGKFLSGKSRFRQANFRQISRTSHHQSTIRCLASQPRCGSAQEHGAQGEDEDA